MSTVTHFLFSEPNSRAILLGHCSTLLFGNSTDMCLKVRNHGGSGEQAIAPAGKTSRTICVARSVFHMPVFQNNGFRPNRFIAFSSGADSPSGLALSGESQRRNWPEPLAASSLPFSTTTRPRLITVTG